MARIAASLQRECNALLAAQQGVLVGLTALMNGIEPVGGRSRALLQSVNHAGEAVIRALMPDSCICRCRERRDDHASVLGGR
jgi:hypothetical protein